MTREPVTTKWQRVTTTKSKRKKCRSWIPYGQLYREIAGGYNHFMAQRMRSGAMKQ